jgi:cathepsin F
MKTLILLCTISLIITHKPFIFSEEFIETNYEYLFNDFITEHNKDYSEQEHIIRLKIFKNNLYTIKHLQQNDDSAEYGITEYTDLTEQEFTSKYLGGISDSTPTTSSITSNHTIPTSFDWREHGKVTPIKNQGNCGACWAFASTQVIESHFAIKYNNLIQLSPQQMVDCDKVAHGCHGGYHFEALDYVKRQGGIEAEQDYKYEAQRGECRFDETKVAAKVSGYFNVTSDENEMAKTVSEIGPLVVGADAQYWMFYLRGIYNFKLCSDVNNHAVVIV